MKSTVFSLIFVLLTQVVFSQSKGGSGSSFALSQDQLLTSSGLLAKPATKALNNYELQLLPGQKFVGCYYFWSYGDPLSANYKETPEVTWLNINPRKFTSTGCSNVIPVKFTFNAPLAEGDYETILIDSLGNWSNLTVRVRVTSSPQNCIVRKFGVNTDSLTYKNYIKHVPFNWSDNTCLHDYFPVDTLRYIFNIYSGINWLKITPSPGKVFRNNMQTLQNTIKKRLYDSTWVVLERDYYSFPAIYHYYVKETEPKDYMLKFNGKNLISTGYYPSNLTKTLMFWVRFDEISVQAIGSHDLLNHRFYLGINADNSLFAGMGDLWTPLTSLNLIPGKWYNMVLTTSRDGDSAIVYINATEVSRWEYTFSGESKASLYIGGRNDSVTNIFRNPVKGLVEEVQVWEKPLSRNEIIKYMFTPPKGDENGLIIYYPFSEGWGNFTKNAVDTFYYGTLYNDPVWIDSIKRPNDPSIIITSVEENIHNEAKSLKLSCRPNPFSNNTEIIYYLPGNGKVLLELFDMSGTLVRTLLNTTMISGVQTFSLNDATLPKGMYFVKLIFTNSKGSLVQSIKILHSYR